MRLLPFYFLVLASLFFSCKSDTGAPQKGPEPASQGAAPTPAPARKKTIVFFGNSLTAAYNLAQEQGFPALIQQKIDSLRLPYTCINAGLSGETTAGGNTRADWILQQPVDVFVLELGGNDALRGIDLKASKANLQAIIDKVRAKYPDCKIVLAGMLAPPNMGPTYTKDFRDMYPALARANKIALIPFLLDGVAADPKLNLEDGIHPNVEGQKIVAENVWKVLKTQL